MNKVDYLQLPFEFSMSFNDITPSHSDAAILFSLSPEWKKSVSKYATTHHNLIPIKDDGSSTPISFFRGFYEVAKNATDLKREIGNAKQFVNIAFPLTQLNINKWPFTYSLNFTFPTAQQTVLLSETIQEGTVEVNVDVNDELNKIIDAEQPQQQDEYLEQYRNQLRLDRFVTNNDDETDFYSPIYGTSSAATLTPIPEIVKLQQNSLQAGDNSTIILHDSVSELPISYQKTHPYPYDSTIRGNQYDLFLKFKLTTSVTAFQVVVTPGYFSSLKYPDDGFDCYVIEFYRDFYYNT
jgi:hypothetical protein